MSFSWQLSVANYFPLSSDGVALRLRFRTTRSSNFFSVETPRTAIALDRWLVAVAHTMHHRVSLLRRHFAAVIYRADTVSTLMFNNMVVSFTPDGPLVVLADPSLFHFFFFFGMQSVIFCQLNFLC